MTRASVCLAVCIDDFGMHGGVNDAALELGSAARVSAVSCMVDGPAWRDGAPALQRALRGKVDIGMHLDLTQPWQGRARRSLPSLIVAAYTGGLSPRYMIDEVRRQLDAFEDAAGTAPEFVDGHQHVHQLPTIREALVAELLRRYPRQLPWIRNTAAVASSLALKPRLIGMLGGAAMRCLARRGGFRQNRRLLGVYGFAGTASAYRQRVGRWLAQAQDGDLLMCHPAAHGRDALAGARRIEYAFLRSDEFAALLLRHRVTIVRLGVP